MENFLELNFFDAMAEDVKLCLVKFVTQLVL